MEKIQINKTMLNIKKPEPPSCKVMEEGVGEYCSKCGSTLKREYRFLGFHFGGVVGCANEKCNNYYKNK